MQKISDAACSMVTAVHSNKRRVEMDSQQPLLFRKDKKAHTVTTKLLRNDLIRWHKILSQLKSLVKQTWTFAASCHGRLTKPLTAAENIYWLWWKVADMQAHGHRTIAIYYDYDTMISSCMQIHFKLLHIELCQTSPVQFNGIKTDLCNAGNVVLMGYWGIQLPVNCSNPQFRL